MPKESTVMPTNHGHEMDSIAQSCENDGRRGKKYRAFRLCGIFFGIALAILWAMGGLLVLDYRDYAKQDERITSDNGDIPSLVNCSVRLSANYELRDFAGLLEYEYSGGPYQPRINIRSETHSPYDIMLIKNVAIILPDGTTTEVLSDNDVSVHFDLKLPESLRDPREYTLGGTPEDLKKFYSLQESVPVELPLDWEKHETCTLLVKGVLLDRAGKESSFSLSTTFERSKIFRIALKLWAQMSV